MGEFKDHNLTKIKNREMGIEKDIRTRAREGKKWAFLQGTIDGVDTYTLCVYILCMYVYIQSHLQLTTVLKTVSSVISTSP